MAGSLGRDGGPMWGIGAVATPGGHSSDGVQKVGGHPGTASGTPIVMPCATGTPTQGDGWGHPGTSPGCWRTLSCCKQPGRKQTLRVGRGFFLFYHFILKPNTAGLGVRLLQPVPWGGGGVGYVPSPGATEESLGQGEMTPKLLQMMKCPDSFEILILKKKKSEVEVTQAVVPCHLVVTEQLLGVRLFGWIFPWSIITPRGIAEGSELA